LNLDEENMRNSRNATTILTILLVSGMLICVLGIFMYIALDQYGTEGITQLFTNTGKNHEPELTPTPYAFEGQQSVQLAWFYKPPNDSSMRTIVDNFDFITLTLKDEVQRDEARAMGWAKPIPQYFRLDGIRIKDCQEDPPGNQVAYHVGDYCSISENHPDWFLLDATGNRIYDGSATSGYAMMDPGNPAWQQFFLARIQESQTQLGWNGVLLDNVDASLGRIQKLTDSVRQYPNDDSFQEAVEGFLKYLYESYFRPQQRPLYANIVSQRGSETWYRYLAYLDGALVEGWALGWHDDYRAPEDWDSHLTGAENTQGMGKEVILVPFGTRNDLIRQQFALGSYLLINHGRAYLRYGHSSNYRETWLYENYELDLGIPLGTRYQDGEVWRRDFTKGSVWVNPSTQEVGFEFR